MTTLTFTRATKKQLKARVALEGPSGSGKTYTALVTARALGGRVAVIDTERRSAELYADLFEFDTLQLDRFAPDLLIEALAAAAAAAYDVVIIDSWSHFWMGADGMLEQVDRAAKRSGGGNSFAGWKELRPLERKMIDAILAYPGHVIATLRVKTEYAVEENDRGKKVPRKIGLKAEQRDGLEYEFTLVAALDLDNTLVVSKSRCPVLSGAVINRPTEEFGRTLLNWLDAGETVRESAAQLRDEILARPGASREELLDFHQRARAAGWLGAAIVDEHGDATTLGEWIVARGQTTQSAAAAAPPAADPWEEAAPAARPVSDNQHKAMHALWTRLGYGGETNRDRRLEATSRILGRTVESSSTMTNLEAATVIEALESRVKGHRAQPAADAPVSPAPARGPAITQEQRTALTRLLRQLNLMDPAAGLVEINTAIEPDEVASTKDLTQWQAARVIGHLQGLVPA